MRNNSVDITSLILQVYNLILLMKDYNNSDLMQELKKQDKQYFETIIKNQKEILELHKERR